MEDEELVGCPNCQCLTAQSDLRPISIGAIYRHARVVEKAQYALVKAGQAQSSDGQVIPLQSLFSDLKINWVPMPPILEHLNYNIEEIGRHTSLQQKETHICQQCFDVYADEQEVNHRAARAQSAHNRRGGHSSPKKYQSSSSALEFERNSDRKKDFAFTSLQTSIRTRECAIDEKRRARRKLVELQISDVDWEGLPASAGKEIRRIQEELSHMELAVIGGSTDSGIAAGSLVPSSPPDKQHRYGSAKYQSPSRRLGSAHSARGHTLLPLVGDPLTSDEVDQIYALTGSVIPVDEDPRTSFDVPLQHRFMHELWTRMCSELDYGAEDKFLHLTDARGEHVRQHQQKAGAQVSPTSDPVVMPSAQIISVSVPPDPTISAERPPEFNPRADSLFSASTSCRGFAKVHDPVPVRHPFFLLLHKNQLRLPTPPVPLMVQKPNVVSTAANVEDAILRVDHLLLKNGKAIRQRGMQDAFMFKELTREEQDLLAVVVGDPTIVVASDDDDDDIAHFESEEEDDAYVEEDEEDGAGAFDDY